MNPHVERPTPEQTAEALEKSIDHWHRHATGTAGPGEEIFGKDCALCALFLDANAEECHDCPVYERTGEHLCESTPWQQAAAAWGLRQARKHPMHPEEFKLAAAKMEQFLISLKPT